MSLNRTEQGRKLAEFFSQYPMIHSCPIYFGNPNRPDSKINNGTGTLLKKGSRLFVATNYHVLREYGSRQEADEGVTLQVGGLRLNNFRERIRFEDEIVDIAVLEFSDREASEFRMLGNVPTEFHELGELDPSEVVKGDFVAFGGYPGAFREREGPYNVNFHTFSSAASTVVKVSDRNIIVNVDHSPDNITLLSERFPPKELGGMSGGPVFYIANEGMFRTLRFAGIISECSTDLKVMFAKPVSLFISAFEK